MIYSGSESSFEFSEFRIRIHADPDQKNGSGSTQKMTGSGNPGITEYYILVFFFFRATHKLDTEAYRRVFIQR